MIKIPENFNEKFEQKKDKAKRTKLRKKFILEENAVKNEDQVRDQIGVKEYEIKGIRITGQPW